MYNSTNIPTSQGWVKRLSAKDAADQVIALNMEPAPTLEENRIKIVGFIRSVKGSVTESSVEVDQGKEENQAVLDGALGEGETAGVQSGPSISEGDSHPKGEPLSEFTRALSSVVRTIHEQTLETIQACARNSVPAHGPGSSVAGELVREIRSNSGGDEKSLVEFLRQVENVASLKVMGDREIVMATLGKTSGALRTIWSEAISRELGWGALRDKIIRDYFPPREMRILLESTVYRLQRPEEPFRDFVADVRQWAKLLGPALTEQEVVGIIMQQINPKTRSHFAMRSYPTSYEDLEVLAGVSSQWCKLDEEHARTFQGLGQRQNNGRGWHGGESNPGDGRQGYPPQGQYPRDGPPRGLGGRPQLTRGFPYRPQPGAQAYQGDGYQRRGGYGSGGQFAGNARGGHP